MPFSSQLHLSKVKSQVAIDGEMLTPTATRLAKLTDNEKAKRNCLMVIVRNINRVKPIAEVEIAIKTKNMANIFFLNQEEQIHNGTVNVEVTTPATYKQYITKNIKMLNHYLKFTPHLRSFDRLAAPTRHNSRNLDSSISTRPWLIQLNPYVTLQGLVRQMWSLRQRLQKW